MKFIKSFFMFLLILVVCLEGASFVYVRFFNKNIPLPAYTLVNASSKFWVDMDEHFGVWHKPHSKYVHNKACFTVVYEANSLGMRDVERQIKSDKKRVVVLGDSFIEGWGLELPDRLTNMFEVADGREYLNFGTAGSFGTIQYWQQYKHFAKDFDHDAVIIAIIPKNDFKDNDLEYGREVLADRYRPYLTGTYPDYNLTYFKEKLESRSRPFQLLKSFDFTLRDFSYTYKIIRYVFGTYNISQFKPKWLVEIDQKPEKPYSGYYDFKEDEFQIMRYTLEQIVKEAQGRKALVFTVPNYRDFLRYDGGETPLAKRLGELGRQTGFDYVDLLEPMYDKGGDFKDYYFVCDDHYNVSFQRTAFDILREHVNKLID